ncbi:MAG: hypothetical protein ACLQDY_08385 [Streptosporangiaceae bacterium]
MAHQGPVSGRHSRPPGPGPGRDYADPGGLPRSGQEVPDADWEQTSDWQERDPRAADWAQDPGPAPADWSLGPASHPANWPAEPQVAAAPRAPGPQAQAAPAPGSAGYRRDWPPDHGSHPADWPRDGEPLHGRPPSEDWPTAGQWPERIEWPESADEPAPGHAAVRPVSPARDRWQETFEDTGDDIAPWAGPGSYPTGPGRRQIRPTAETEPAGPAGPGGAGAPPPRRRGRSRLAAGKQRRSRRRVIAAAAAAIITVLAVASGYWLLTGKKHAASNDGFVSTLQHGDFRSVPDACRMLGGTQLSQDMAGVARTRQIQPSATSTLSQCSVTADAPPVFRVLQTTVQAYQPSLLASGNGSADANATDSYFAAQHQLADPARRSRLPKAVISPLTALGQAAFSALQVVRGGGNVNDLVTVVVRDHNALVTVSLQALDRAPGHKYGPVSVTQLQAEVLATARAALARVMTGPTVS